MPTKENTMQKRPDYTAIMGVYIMLAIVLMFTALVFASKQQWALAVASIVALLWVCAYIVRYAVRADDQQHDEEQQRLLDEHNKRAANYSRRRTQSDGAEPGSTRPRKDE
jgi:type IV secretory pathway VirB3-like protein